MTEVGGWVSGSTARDHKLGTNAASVRPDDAGPDRQIPLMKSASGGG